MKIRNLIAVGGASLLAFGTALAIAASPSGAVDASPTATVTSTATATPQACQTATYTGVVRDTDVSLDPATRKTWYSEDGAPTFLAVGAKFITPLATSKNNLFRGVSVPLAGVQGLGYHIDNTTADPSAAYDLEVLTTGTAGYTTFVFEPYQQAAGNAVNTDGTFTNIETGKWWSTHISSGPGSQASPITLAALSTIYPSAQIISYGVGQGSSNAGAQTTLYSLSFLCGTSTFTNVPAVVVTTTTSTSTPPPPFKKYKTTCVFEMPAPDTATVNGAFQKAQVYVSCGADAVAPTDCGKLYQVDLYGIDSTKDQATLDAIVKAKSLSKGDDSSIFLSYKFVQNKACATETTTASTTSATTTAATTASTTSAGTSATQTTTAALVADSQLPFTGAGDLSKQIGLLVALLLAGGGLLGVAWKFKPGRQH